jgi:hypothetical protein
MRRKKRESDARSAIERSDTRGLPGHRVTDSPAGWLSIAVAAWLGGCDGAGTDVPTEPGRFDGGDADAGIGIVPDAAISCQNPWADAGPTSDADPTPRFDDAPARILISLTEANRIPYLKLLR